MTGDLTGLIEGSEERRALVPRIAKAQALEDALESVAGSAQEAHDAATELDARGWKLLAEAAGVNAPSKRTVAVVIRGLKQRAEWDRDPGSVLRGLPS